MGSPRAIAQALITGTTEDSHDEVAKPVAASEPDPCCPRERHLGARQLEGRAEQDSALLPPGVRAVWDLSKADRETTPTRERVCINGLWRWQPAETGNASAPAPTSELGLLQGPRAAGPGSPTTCRRTARRSSRIRAGRTTAGQRVRGLVPAGDHGSQTLDRPSHCPVRRVPELLAAVFVDGKPAGEMRFPGGELDLTAMLPPRRQARAQPARRGNAAEGRHAVVHRHRLGPAGEGTVPRRGLCGDVYLVGTPEGARIADVKVDTSVRQWQITFTPRLQGLAADEHYSLRPGSRRTAAT